MKNNNSTKVTPLISGEEYFSSMRESIQNSRKNIMLAYWTVEPDLGALTKAGDKNDRGSSWTEILLQKAEDGVKVYLIIADFDPILANH